MIGRNRTHARGGGAGRRGWPLAARRRRCRPTCRAGRRREAGRRRADQDPRHRRSRAISRATPSIATSSCSCRRATPRRQAARYPVVYALHGYSIGAEQWAQEIHVPQTIEGAFAQGAREMIVVLPDSKTAHNGSMYSSSVTTGDFERYVSDDVVAYIDAHYRTIPDRKSRGLVGHSMGGYGATRIGMKHADVFGSLYIMSPCCLSARPAGPAEHGPREGGREAMKSPADSAKPRRSSRVRSSRRRRRGHRTRRSRRSISICRRKTASRARRSSRSGRPTRRWRSSISTSAACGSYRAIAIDVGDQDGLKADTGKLHDMLDRYGIANGVRALSGHAYEQVADRFQNHVLPFFSKTLCFTATCQ